MKNISFVVVFLSIFSAGTVCAGFLTPRRVEDFLTLHKAYELALKRSEDVAISANAIEEAQAHFYQALDVIMPKVSFVMTHERQDDGGSAGSSNSNLTRTSTPQKKFVFSQPIFSGFKEFAALQAAGAEKKERRFELKRAKELLFIDVMEVFYSALEAQKDVEILESNHKLLEKRVQELKERVRVGRSRQSEVETAISEIKVNEADLVDARQSLEVLKQLLEFYIGTRIEARLAEDKLKDSGLGQDDYLQMSASRSDVLAAAEAHFLSEKKIVVAQSDLFPSVKLDGNYYTQRVGIQSGIDWDALLTIDVPVFTGTEVIGNIKEAVAARDEQEFILSRTRRKAELETRSGYEKLMRSREREAALKEASDALRRSYESQEKEYRLNLVNNLQVLDALRRYQDITRDANAAHIAAGKNFWKLKIAAGESVLDGEKT